MALIKCPECKKKISNTIKTCPNCGYELKEEDRKVKKKKPILKIIILCILLIFIVGFAVLEYQGLQDRAKQQKTEQIQKEKFIKNVNSYIDVEKDVVEEVKEIVTFRKKVWRNCNWETEDPETDKYTKNSKGHFFDDFNDALQKYENSDKAAEQIEKVEEESIDFEDYYSKITSYKTTNKSYKKIKKYVQDITAEFKNLLKYDATYGYSYSEYDSKTEDYFNNIQELETDLEQQVGSLE